MNKKYDIIVIGGGFTGVAAAVMAAKSNAKVLIIEQSGALGGAAVNCLVNPFMRYWVDQTDANGNEVKYPINRGIFLEILDRLDKMGGLLAKNRMTFNEEYLKLILDDLCRENNVDVLFHTTLIGAKRTEDTIQEVEIFCTGIRQYLSASYYVDCTGDANLAALADCPFAVGREEDSLCQPMTLCFRLSNIDTERFWQNKSKITPLYNEYQKAGKISNPRENVLLFDTTATGVVHFNTTRIVKRSPLDPWDLSFAEQEARKQIIEIYSLLKENIGGCENADLIMTAPQIGVRESRMIIGEYTITEDDLLSCKKFEDSVARGTYGVDIHSPDGTGTLLKHIPKGDYYTIPYHALIPQGVKNMLAAGRCISSTHAAQSAYRVMPICCSIGEGAGAALAIALQNKTAVIDVDMSAVHKLMDQYDAAY